MSMITEVEEEVVKILVQLPRIILEREASAKLKFTAVERDDVPKWAHKRKCSVPDEDDDSGDHNAHRREAPKGKCTRDDSNGIDVVETGSLLSGQESEEGDQDQPVAEAGPAAHNGGGMVLLNIDLNQAGGELGVGRHPVPTRHDVVLDEKRSSS